MGLNRNGCQSSSPPCQQVLTGRGSHTTVRTGLVYGGSSSISIIALYTNDTSV